MNLPRTVLISAILILTASCNSTPNAEGGSEIPLSIKASMTCNAEGGYVLHFTLANLGKSEEVIPDALLPWSPSGLAIRMFIATSDRQLAPMGLVADDFGRTSMVPGKEIHGSIRLSLLFDERVLDQTLRDGDATLKWEYKVHGFEIFPPTGEILISGGETYSKCLVDQS